MKDKKRVIRLPKYGENEPLNEFIYIINLTQKKVNIKIKEKNTCITKMYKLI